MKLSTSGIAAGALGLFLIAGVSSGCAPRKAEIDPAQMARIEAAANKAEMAANKAEAAARSASEAAQRAESSAQKAEAIFAKSMHK
jgi:hypothetical protein